MQSWDEVEKKYASFTQITCYGASLYLYQGGYVDKHLNTFYYTMDLYISLKGLETPVWSWRQLGTRQKQGLLDCVGDATPSQAIK
jgi:hypothetical protein